MLAKQIFEDISAKIGDIVRDSPVKDIEKNVKSALAAALARMDLVTREEFEIQQQMLEHVCREMAALQEEVAALRAQNQPPAPHIADSAQS